jgi:hypothetical protein
MPVAEHRISAPDHIRKAPKTFVFKSFLLQSASAGSVLHAKFEPTPMAHRILRAGKFHAIFLPQQGICLPEKRVNARVRQAQLGG